MAGWPHAHLTHVGPNDDDLPATAAQYQCHRIRREFEAPARATKPRRSQPRGRPRRFPKIQAVRIPAESGCRRVVHVSAGSRHYRFLRGDAPALLALLGAVCLSCRPSSHLPKTSRRQYQCFTRLWDMRPRPRTQELPRELERAAVALDGHFSAIPPELSSPPSADGRRSARSLEPRTRPAPWRHGDGRLPELSIHLRFLPGS